MAPQVLQGVYSSQADMWSLGVMSYMVSYNRFIFVIVNGDATAILLSNLILSLMLLFLNPFVDTHCI